MEYMNSLAIVNHNVNNYFKGPQKKVTIQCN